ncbi:MAG: hypothetical protein FWC72_05270, partial [Oscillospiraceae bacterium]|nr:hypothetical protein [Oscillospiraceae bacterium]
MRKRYLFLLIVILVLIVLAACGGSPTADEVPAVGAILPLGATAVQELEVVSPSGEVLFIEQAQNDIIWSLWQENDMGDFSVRTLEIDVEAGRINATNVVFTLHFSTEYRLGGFSVSDEVVTLFFPAGDLVADPGTGEYFWFFRDRIGVIQFDMDGRPRFDINLNFGTTEPVEFQAATTDANGMVYV